MSITEQRIAICDWLRANGIDPGEVPADAPISYADGVLTYRKVVRNGDGIAVENGEVVTVEATATVEGVPPWAR
jgi:hypothetical protein